MVKILVCCHKKSFVPTNEIYQPIHVGKANILDDLGFIGDNQGDNISHLNRLYCELTGLYWGWKHINEDYIGLCHYRRYFAMRNKQFLKSSLVYCYKRICQFVSFLTNNPSDVYFYKNKYTVSDEFIMDKECSEFSKQLVEYIKKKPEIDVFALKPVCLGAYNNSMYVSSVAGRCHLDIISSIVKEQYPDIWECLDYTYRSNKLHYGNMIIMKKSVFNDYCNFIFTVLQTHLKIIIDSGLYVRIDENSLNRLSGYLGELLTSTYVTYIKKVSRNKVKLLNMIQLG